MQLKADCTGFMVKSNIVYHGWLFITGDVVNGIIQVITLRRVLVNLIPRARF